MSHVRGMSGEEVRGWVRTLRVKNARNTEWEVVGRYNALSKLIIRQDQSIRWLMPGRIPILLTVKAQ